MAPQPVRGGHGRARARSCCWSPGTSPRWSSGWPTPAERLECAPAFLDRARALLDEPRPALWRQMAWARPARGRVPGRHARPLAAGTRLAGRVEPLRPRPPRPCATSPAGWAGRARRPVPRRRPVRHRRGRPGPQVREVHCFTTTPAEFAGIGEAQIEELTAALTEQAGKLGGPTGRPSSTSSRPTTPTPRAAAGLRARAGAAGVVRVPGGPGHQPGRHGPGRGHPEFLRPVMAGGCLPSPPARSTPGSRGTSGSPRRRTRPACATTPTPSSPPWPPTRAIPATTCR